MSSTTCRTRLLTLAAALLALTGATKIVYSGFLPLPPFSDAPVPLAWQAIGVVELVAAFGVFRVQAWGRVLGVVMVAVGLALAVALAAAQLARSSPAAELASLAVSGAYAGVVLWVLLRRWPPRA